MVSRGEAGVMCLLAVYFRAIDDAFVVVGANREEKYARGGTPPQLFNAGAVSALGGVDPVGRGTWLAVNQYGVIVSVTNRPKSAVPASPRSRGLLLRDLLACTSAKAAADLARAELTTDRYAGCNVICVDRDDFLVLHAGDCLRVWPLPPGLHLLTSRDINDNTDARLVHARRWLRDRHPKSAAACADLLTKLLAQTGNGGPAICLRGKEGGTVSSSIIALSSLWTRSAYLHAQGPPDRTPYINYSDRLTQMSEGPPVLP